MTPIGSTTRAIEIVPTPIVPYASVLSQQGQLFSPTTVANIPYAPHVLPATTIDLTPTDSGTTKVLKILDAGRLVPVNLPGLENGTKEKPLKAVPAALEKPVVVEKKMASAQAEAKPTPAVATPLELGSVAKKIAEGETSETKTALESAPKKPAVVEGQAKIVPLPPVEREEPSREAVPQKAMPLKTAPQKATPLNLPQPPIPLEYPKTGL
ncbi:MAG: hypothetical protein K8U03_07185 [Planctomycetia bacterium]|nr:hypothetical protein [Planctomycetia bacterium]